MTKSDLGEIAVIGAGIVGLSSGLRLLEAGRRVAIYARDVTPETTSSVAGAFWFPFGVAPAKRGLQWGNDSRRAYEAMVREGVPGVRIAPLAMVFRSPIPGLERALAGATLIPSRELPGGFAQGIRLDIPVIEPPLILRWAQEQFLKRGGRIERREIKSGDELFQKHRLVVNCSGIGAHELVPDPLVQPVRGEVLWVKRPEGLPDTVWMHEEGHVMTYVIPRSRDCVLGGTSELGNWNRTPEPAKAAAIRQRCLELEPALAGAEIRAHHVGLRPGRPEVRVELERHGDRRVIHNYGHGGIGFSLAWGCALDVVKLADETGDAP
jgi:D-amino-acid oxidase